MDLLAHFEGFHGVEQAALEMVVAAEPQGILDVVGSGRVEEDRALALEDRQQGVNALVQRGGKVREQVSLRDAADRLSLSGAVEGPAQQCQRPCARSGVALGIDGCQGDLLRGIVAQQLRGVAQPEHAALPRQHIAVAGHDTGSRDARSRCPTQRRIGAVEGVANAEFGRNGVDPLLGLIETAEVGVGVHQARQRRFDLQGSRTRWNGDIRPDRRDLALPHQYYALVDRRAGDRIEGLRADGEGVRPRRGTALSAGQRGSGHQEATEGAPGEPFGKILLFRSLRFRLLSHFAVYTSLPFTKTRATCAAGFQGSAVRTTRSASFPIWMLPTRSAMPRIRAASSVMARNAWSGDTPYPTASAAFSRRKREARPEREFGVSARVTPAFASVAVVSGWSRRVSRRGG